MARITSHRVSPAGVQTLGAVLTCLVITSLFPTSCLGEIRRTVQVGAIYAMTGDWSSWGVNCQQATELAVAEINKSPDLTIEMHIEDSPNAKPVQALSAFRKLVDINKVQVILGPMSPEEFGAVAPLAKRAKIPLIPFVSSKISTPAALFVWIDPLTETTRLAEYVIKRHKKVAILSSTQEWESDVGRMFKDFFNKHGGEVRLLEEPPFDATDVRSNVLRLKQSEFDGIFITSYLLFPQYIKALQNLKIDVDKYSIELDATAVSNAGPGANGVQFIRPAEPSDAFISAFKAKWHKAPDIPSSQCYDAVGILARAVRSGVSDYSTFVDHVRSFQKYSGASGSIEIRDGKTLISTDLFEVKKNVIINRGPIPG